MADDCMMHGCESCAAAWPGFGLRGTCATCGHALCPTVLPRRLGGLA